MLRINHSTEEETDLGNEVGPVGVAALAHLVGVLAPVNDVEPPVIAGHLVVGDPLPHLAQRVGDGDQPVVEFVLPFSRLKNGTDYPMAPLLRKYSSAKYLIDKICQIWSHFPGQLLDDDGGDPVSAKAGGVLERHAGLPHVPTVNLLKFEGSKFSPFLQLFNRFFICDAIINKLCHAAVFHASMLPYFHAAMLLSFHTDILPCCCLFMLPCCCATAILLSFYAAMLLCCYVALLLCCHAAVFSCCHNFKE